MTSCNHVAHHYLRAHYYCFANIKAKITKTNQSKHISLNSQMLLQIDTHGLLQQLSCSLLIAPPWSWTTRKKWKDVCLHQEANNSCFTCPVREFVGQHTIHLVTHNQYLHLSLHLLLKWKTMGNDWQVDSITISNTGRRQHHHHHWF